MKDTKGNVLKNGQRVKLSNGFRKKYDVYASEGIVIEASGFENTEGLVTVKLPNGDDMDVHFKSLTIMSYDIVKPGQQLSGPKTNRANKFK